MERTWRFALTASLLLACGGGQTTSTTPAPAPVDAGVVPDAAPAPTAAIAAPPASGLALTTPVDSVANELFVHFAANDAAGVESLFGGPMREASPLEKTKVVVEGVLATKGKLLHATRVPGKGGDRSGTYRFEAERGSWNVELVVGPDGKVLGLQLTEPPPPEPAVAKSTIPLHLPFRGQWFVFWGGDTLEKNQHVPHTSQRRAADLVVVDASGSTHAGDGKKNSDYFAYGKEVLAAADGVVLTVIDGVPENEPGSLNPYFVTGNIVVLEHPGPLYSVYAHLQPGKIRVRQGAKVTAGSVLGLCGNSGNTSEPHLHFQLQDGPRFEKSWGVEPLFSDVLVTSGGTTEKRAQYTWSKGDRVGTPAK